MEELLISSYARNSARTETASLVPHHVLDIDELDVVLVILRNLQSMVCRVDVRITCFAVYGFWEVFGFE